MQEDDAVKRPQDAGGEATTLSETPPPTPRVVGAASPEQAQKRVRLAEEQTAEVLAACEELRSQQAHDRERVGREAEHRYLERRNRLLIASTSILEKLDVAIETAHRTSAAGALVEGLLLVRTQLSRALREEGLERVSVLGLPYDPALSTLAGTRPVDDPAHHDLVVEEVVSGHRIDGRIVRRSEVIVGRYEQPVVSPAAPELPVPEPPRVEAAPVLAEVPPVLAEVPPVPAALPDVVAFETPPAEPPPAQPVEAELPMPTPAAEVEAPEVWEEEAPAAFEPQPAVTPEPAAVPEPAVAPEPVAAPEPLPAVAPAPVEQHEEREPSFAEAAPAAPGERIAEEPAPPPVPSGVAPAPPLLPRVPPQAPPPVPARMPLERYLGVGLAAAVLAAGVTFVTLLATSTRREAGAPPPAPAASIAAEQAAAPAPEVRPTLPTAPAAQPEAGVAQPPEAPPATLAQAPPPALELPEAAAARPAPTPAPRATAAPPKPAPPAPKPAEGRAQGPAAQLGGLLAEGSSALAARRYDDAIAAYEQALALDPQSAEAGAGRSRALLARELARRTFVTGRTAVETAKASKGLSGFDTSEVELQKAPRDSGTIEFEVAPTPPRAGEPYTVRVYLTNLGKKTIKVAAMTLAITANGARSGGSVSLQAAEVPAGRKVLLHERTETWLEETTSWTADVVLTTSRDETLRGQASWR